MGRLNQCSSPLSNLIIALFFPPNLYINVTRMCSFLNHTHLLLDQISLIFLVPLAQTLALFLLFLNLRQNSYHIMNDLF